MPLKSGTKLGPYEIASALGAGGMGEVYRARDPRLNRDVAIKVLPANYASDADRLQRFEQEAIASSALNHANILTVYDFGTHEGAPYLVTELLDGQELATILNHGALPVRKAMEYARQIAAGLAAAHEKGIVHRDLKPANLFVSHDGRVKILDFGLAKLNPAGATAWGAAATIGGTIDSAPAHTAAGVVLGTAGYMAPEQVRGQAADHRSDIFAFGAVLYEMLSGHRAFKGDTAVETMTAILKEDPPELSPSGLRVSPALDRTVRRCLEKEPDQRFQSAKDLAFALEALSGGSESVPAIGGIPATKRSRRPWIGAGGLIVAAMALTIFLFPGRRRGVSIPTRITPVSFRDGYVRMARFAPDGQSIVYGAMWDGGPVQLYSGRIDGPESHTIDPPKADLLSVSPMGELAVSLNRRFMEPWVPMGTLARVSSQGGMPREIVVGALDADWSPDGASLAYSTRSKGRFQLRLFPTGKVLYETAGYISHLRFSPDGKRIAFMDHPIYGDDRGTVAVVDMQGIVKTLTPEYATEQGLAWTPDGSELWFTANPDLDWSLWATTLEGKVREVTRDAAILTLQDISRQGRVLVTTIGISSQVIAGGAAGPETKNLVTYQWGNAAAFSSDGGKVAITEFNAPSPSTDYAIYIRKVDGSPATALAAGTALDFSPDGKRVLAFLPSQNDKLILIPTGAGETQTLPSSGLHYHDGRFLPDGKRMALVAAETGKASRIYLESLDGKTPPRPITPEGTAQGMVISPDGKWVIALVAGSEESEEGAQRTVMMYPVDGDAQPRPVRGVGPEEMLVQWLNDGKLLVAGRGEMPLQVFKLDPATGKRELWRKFVPSEPAGVLSFHRIFVTRDGKHYLYETRRVLSNLFVLEGLK
jgi:eukaryotic-like serine/threonine-protein kinase